jgi:hypothetical protein
MRIKRSLTFLTLAGVVLFAGTHWAPKARAGSITYDVSVDTTSYSGTTGGVQFTLIGGNSPVPLDTASISAFVPQAGLVPPPTTSGDVTGDLSSTLTMDNQNASLFFEALTYGTSLTFQVTLTSTAGTSSSADTLFSFYLFDANGNPISSSNSPSGEALDINIEGPSGAFDPPVLYSPPPTIIVTQAVPEPSSVVLLGLGRSGL